MGKLIHRYRGAIPYLLLLPGLLWLFLFFIMPNIQMVLFSLSEGTLMTGFTTPPEVWAFNNFPDAVTRYSSNFVNSIVYGGLATLLCFLIGYPLAYGIAFRGGRYKSLLLFLVIAPWTDAWERIVLLLPLASLRLLFAVSWVRGLVSGFGLVHIVWAAHDVDLILRPPPDRVDPSLPTETLGRH